MSRGTMLRLPEGRGRQRGFTLVEMLVVSALIALFAGLAVFSITTQLEQNKKKAAVAECRQIATAMSFAQQDLGFFPKLCLLKFNYENLIAEGSRRGFNDTSVEYHGHLVSGLSQKLKDSWKGVYMTNNVDRLVDMKFGPSSTIEMKWPADPWGNPYVAYLIRTEKAQQGATAPEQTFLQNSGQHADFFAGVVSYGRNGVPGLGDNAQSDPNLRTAMNNRRGLRLYTDNGFGKFTLLSEADYASRGSALLKQAFLADPATETIGEPRTLEPGSDDRIYQF